MVDTVYVEEGALEYARTQRILAKLPKATHIQIEKYSQVFNSHAQNFRAQKINPALILAVKPNKKVQPAPEQYETGGGAAYYFSHILNCPYDCRYCFLQGMFRSAHYLLFVNYEDFAHEIQTTALQHAQDDKPAWFYSGYDGDSLAYEPVTQFAEYFIQTFTELPSAVLELRTKSTQVRALLNTEAIANVVVAYSLSPNPVIQAFEKGTPSLEKRVQALVQLQDAGWRIGLRFDPVIWHENYQTHYRDAIQTVFSQLDADKIDSVTVGGFRLPKGYFKTVRKLYPSEKLFSLGLNVHQGMQCYQRSIEQDILGLVQQQVGAYMPAHKVFLYPSYSTESEA